MSLAILGCAGLGGTVPEGFEAVCEAPPAPPGPNVVLPVLGGDRQEVPEAPAVVMTGHQVWLDDAPADDLVTQAAALQRERVAAAEASDEPPSRSVQLWASAEVPVEQVVEVLGALHEAGLGWVVLVGSSDETFDVPPPLEPELAAELAALPVDASMRAMELAQRIEHEIRWCPGAQRTFEALAAASPDVKCELAVQGMREALPSCPLTSAARVLTLQASGCGHRVAGHGGHVRGPRHRCAADRRAGHALGRRAAAARGRRSRAGLDRRGVALAARGGHHCPEDGRMWLWLSLAGCAPDAPAPDAQLDPVDRLVRASVALRRVRPSVADQPEGRVARPGGPAAHRRRLLDPRL
ncbi:MAG: hypothetical protein R3F59_06670 [Myxococcota bacterium]